MIAATATSTPHPHAGILTICARQKTDSDGAFLELIRTEVREFIKENIY
jgi:hypothetical protein